MAEKEVRFIGPLARDVGLRTVVAHGNHDQSTHGNWAHPGGGGDFTVGDTIRFTPKGSDSPILLEVTEVVHPRTLHEQDIFGPGPKLKGHVRSESGRYLDYPSIGMSGAYDLPEKYEVVSKRKGNIYSDMEEGQSGPDIIKSPKRRGAEGRLIDDLIKSGKTETEAKAFIERMKVKRPA